MEVQTGFWWEDLRERDYSGRCTPPWKESIKIVLQGVGWEGNELD